jgi:hypothetical protein
MDVRAGTAEIEHGARSGAPGDVSQPPAACGRSESAI